MPTSALYIPTPNLIRAFSDKLRLFLGGMGPLSAAFAGLADTAKHPVHGGDRAQVHP